jgi:hypothetical protein
MVAKNEHQLPEILALYHHIFLTKKERQGNGCNRKTAISNDDYVQIF